MKTKKSFTDGKGFLQVLYCFLISRDRVINSGYKEFIDQNNLTPYNDNFC